MNIKIGKGGSGKINSTKGGTSKLNQKKYIDLLPPIFINKVTLSGGNYSNGVYTRNSGGTTTFNGSDGKSIVWVGPGWGVFDPLGQGWPEDPTYRSLDLITWTVDTAPNPPIGITENSLTFLFDPIFYKNEIQNERYQIKLEGCSLSYVNGIYSQTVNPSLINNKPYFLKDDDDIIIYYEAGNWYIYDQQERDYSTLFNKIYPYYTSASRPDYVDWSTPDGGDAYNNGETPPTITQYLNLTYNSGGDLDPAFLEQVRNYQINNTIPNQGLKPLTIQHIANSSFNTKKIIIKNNMFSYIKDPNNNDVEDKNFRRNYGSMYRTSNSFSIGTPQDNRKAFLKLEKNDSSILYTSNNSTLNFFIRLQRPVSHKNPNTGYIVREKRGTFLTSYANQGSHLSFGYRSPYYNINGDNTYKYKFEPFSFVFSFGRAYSTVFSKPVNYTVMTDYKYKFGEVYLVSIVINNYNISIYINGELQDIALLPFNPLINRTRKSGGGNATYYAERINQSPLAPNFLKKNGSIYNHINTSWGECPTVNCHYLLFGKSKLNGLSSDRFSRILKRKRTLNNLDIGVINAYSAALSQTEISQIYDNFRYRYI